MCAPVEMVRALSAFVHAALHNAGRRNQKPGGQLNGNRTMRWPAVLAGRTNLAPV